jgi:sugar lactone lactonase YvrE
MHQMIIEQCERIASLKESSRKNLNIGKGIFVFAVILAGFITDFSHLVQTVMAETASESYSLAATLGSKGGCDGQVNCPKNVAVGPDGNVYVVDSMNARIVVFSSAGQHLWKWGSKGRDPGQLDSPWGIAIDRNNDVYVSDASAHRISKFNASGTFIFSWGRAGTSDGQFSCPASVALDSDGNLYVSDFFNNRVQKFNTSTGAFLGKFYVVNLPTGIAVDKNGFIYVGNDLPEVQKIDSKTWAVVKKWGMYGTIDGRFNNIRQITVDRASNVYVVDSYNNRVQKFDSEGNFITKWGASSPEGVARDIAGNVYVTEITNSVIKKFTLDGAPVIASVSPSAGKVGKSVRVTITGTNFQRTPRVVLFRGSYEIPVVVKQYLQKSLSCAFTIPKEAKPGQYNLEVTNPDGKSGGKCAGFTISK